jgi:predicted RNA-binding protein with TRAM domain
MEDRYGYGGDRPRRNNNNFNRPRNNSGFKPVEIGEELNVLIEAKGEKGDGICKKNGFVLFVPNAKEGEKLKIKITKVLNKVGFAEIVGPADESQMEVKEDKTPMAPPEPEPVPEDTDDFGEESVESDESIEEDLDESPEEDSVEPSEEKSENDLEEEEKKE